MTKAEFLERWNHSEDVPEPDRASFAAELELVIAGAIAELPAGGAGGVPDGHQAQWEKGWWRCSCGAMGRGGDEEAAVHQAAAWKNLQVARPHQSPTRFVLEVLRREEILRVVAFDAELEARQAFDSAARDAKDAVGGGYLVRLFRRDVADVELARAEVQPS